MKISVKLQSSWLTILLAMCAIVLTRAPRSLAGASGARQNSSTSHNVPVGETLNGKATYYPNSLNGHQTSSGETFHQNGNTAASNKIPLGTHVKVTNLENGKSTEVRFSPAAAANWLATRFDPCRQRQPPRHIWTQPRHGAVC
jgi:hypothetical protein